MTIYYPMMVDIQNKKCVVIGGGKIATRKIGSLLQAKAKVLVVSPEITEEIGGWLGQEKIEFLQKEFEVEDIRDAFLVIAATNSRAINFRVYNSIRPNQLINIVDQPDLGNFIVPSVVKRGKLTITVSTSGASPLLAKKIKNEISDVYDETYEEYLDFLENSRRYIQRTIDDVKKRNIVYKQLLNSDYLILTREGRVEERERVFLSLVESAVRKGMDC